MKDRLFVIAGVIGIVACSLGLLGGLVSSISAETGTAVPLQQVGRFALGNGVLRVTHTYPARGEDRTEDVVLLLDTCTGQAWFLESSIDSTTNLSPGTIQVTGWTPIERDYTAWKFKVHGWKWPAKAK